MGVGPAAPGELNGQVLDEPDRDGGGLPRLGLVVAAAAAAAVGARGGAASGERGLLHWNSIWIWGSRFDFLFSVLFFNLFTLLIKLSCNFSVFFPFLDSGERGGTQGSKLNWD